MGSDGIERAVAAPVPRLLPQNAVSGEMWAIAILGAILARGIRDTRSITNGEPGEKHEPGSITVIVDCLAVIRAFEAKACGRLTRFPYAGHLKDPALEAVAGCDKVAAHRVREAAEAEGWLDNWLLNDHADLLAKQARRSIEGKELHWTEDRRRRGKLLKQLLGSLPLETLWAAMSRSRPAGGRLKAAREPEPPGTAHRTVYGGAGGGWTCIDCGKRFRVRASALKEDCPGLLPAARLAHPSHALHCAAFEEDGKTLPIVACSRCGAHGTSRVANLGRACPAAAGAVRGRSAAWRRQASRVDKSLHPSRQGVLLVDWRPLPKRQLGLGDRAAAGRSADGAAAGEQPTAEADAEPEPPNDEGEGGEAPQQQSEHYVLEELEAMEAAAAAATPPSAVQEDYGRATACSQPEEEEDIFGHLCGPLWPPTFREAASGGEATQDSPAVLDAASAPFSGLGWTTTVAAAGPDVEDKGTSSLFCRDAFAAFRRVTAPALASSSGAEAPPACHEPQSECDTPCLAPAAETALCTSPACGLEASPPGAPSKRRRLRGKQPPRAQFSADSPFSGISQRSAPDVCLQGPGPPSGET